MPPLLEPSDLELLPNELLPLDLDEPELLPELLLDPESNVLLGDEDLEELSSFLYVGLGSDLLDDSLELFSTLRFGVVCLIVDLSSFRDLSGLTFSILLVFTSEPLLLAGDVPELSLVGLV